jgi:hypothetical protein
MTIKSTYSLIGITALLIGFAVIFFDREKSHEGKVFVHAVPVQTTYGWGYNIMAGEKIYIKQEFIPAVPGKQGFKSAADAQRVGDLVVQKIGSDRMPAISIRELDSLGVIKK